jgi:hypothetical protein
MQQDKGMALGGDGAAVPAWHHLTTELGKHFMILSLCCLIYDMGLSNSGTLGRYESNSTRHPRRATGHIGALQRGPVYQAIALVASLERDSEPERGWGEPRSFGLGLFVENRPGHVS